MRETVQIAVVLTSIVIGPADLLLRAAAQAARELRDPSLPPDVHPDSRNRLPLIERDTLDQRSRQAYDAAAIAAQGRPRGAAAIRLHGSGVNTRWASPLGRQLTELAILTTAREHDQPYEWSLHEMEAIAVGLDPAVIDRVRHRTPLSGVPDRQALVIQVGRAIFGTHRLSSTSYSRALKQFGRGSLVDLVDQT